MRNNAPKLCMTRLFCMLTALILFTAPAYAVSVSAQSAIVYDPLMDRVLFEKNADKKMLIASTTKIMTAVVVLEHASLDEVVTIGPEPPKVEGSSMYLREGERITVGELLHGLLMVSGNDAATALALYVAGDTETFARMMNETASRLELTESSFANPHGLDHKDHYSTARDMAKLSAYAMNIPDFAEIVSSKSDNIPGHSLRNHNKLLWMLEGSDGVKTGFTKKAGRCLVSSASRDGQRLIAVTLSAPDDWNDHINMINSCFDDYPPRVLLDTGKSVENIRVLSGTAQSVSVSPRNPIIRGLSDKEFANVRMSAKLPDFVQAPIHAGDRAGEVTVTLDGKVIAVESLYFDGNVACVNREK